MIYSSPLSAEIRIDGPANFKIRIADYFFRAEAVSPHLNRLLHKARFSSARIWIRPISENPASWHSDGDRSRSHTRALDQKKRGASRGQYTDSVIYINPERIQLSSPSYAGGTLIHELVHAVDLASGRYHDDYRIREKRAVFFQNIWRNSQGKSLRRHYHNRFATLEYQQHALGNSIQSFVDYYFSLNDIP